MNGTFVADDEAEENSFFKVGKKTNVKHYQTLILPQRYNFTKYASKMRLIINVHLLIWRLKI